MSKDFIQPGNNLTLAAPTGGVTAGLPYLIGSMFGVASTTATVGNDFVLETVGCWWLPKTEAQAWDAGDPIYWDADNDVVTNVAGSNRLIGCAIAAAANPSEFGQVRLNGIATEEPASA